MPTNGRLRDELQRTAFNQPSACPKQREEWRINYNVSCPHTFDGLTLEQIWNPVRRGPQLLFARAMRFSPIYAPSADRLSSGGNLQDGNAAMAVVEVADARS
jgi:hypothetical protein